MIQQQQATILLVEDEETVRRLLAEILAMNGYHVLVAANGLEGLATCRDYEGPIDLIITDVVMPQMNGRVMVERAQKLRPSVNVLYMSGYTNDLIMRYGFSNRNFAFIQKPFLPDAFSDKVQQTLTGAIAQAAA